MTDSVFALWKFKTIEGILKYCRPIDFLSTIFTKDLETYIIHYKPQTCTCEIENGVMTFEPRETCTFQELPDKLKKMGLYELKNPADCHAYALTPFQGCIS